MQKLILSLCAAVAASLTGVSPAMAQHAPWRIVEAVGAVRVTEPGQQAASAQVSAPLTAGTTVTTGAASRAALENGQQRIVMTANSRMTIAADSTDAMTRIMQDLGALLFQVDRREQQHFRVETPLLAAVVKGTTFTVTAGGGEDMVHVSQGLVEVSANGGGAPSDVAAGMTARVSRDAPAAVNMGAPNDAAADARDAAPGLDYAEASDGLVTGPLRRPISARPRVVALQETLAAILETPIPAAKAPAQATRTAAPRAAMVSWPRCAPLRLG